MHAPNIRRDGACQEQILELPFLLELYWRVPPIPGHGKLRQLGQGSSIEPLELSGEFRRTRNNRFHLLFAFSPSPVHRGFLARQIHLHLLKLLRDCSQPFVELRTHEILKDSRFLVVLAAQRKPGLRKQRHVYSQSFCQAGC